VNLAHSFTDEAVRIGKLNKKEPVDKDIVGKRKCGDFKKIQNFGNMACKRLEPVKAFVATRVNTPRGYTRPCPKCNKC
jgi:hypothetical protein